MKRHIPILTLVLLIMAALACNFQGQPDPVIVTATPQVAIGQLPTQPPVVDGSGAIVITATPEPTATLAPIVTATLHPDQGMAEANQALHNGNYEHAVDVYRAVLNDQSIDQTIRAEAAYNLGRAAIWEGLFEQGAQALTDFIAVFPMDSRVSQAYFLRGEANMGLGNWEAAISDLRQYLKQRPGIVDSYAYELIGDAQINLGQLEEALESYEAAANAKRTLPSQLALREKLAAAYENLGRNTEAIAQYDLILTEAENAVYRANIEYKAASVEIASGLTDHGYSRLQAMIEIYPNSRAAYLGMIDLLNAGYPVDDWLRARISFSAEDYGDALGALERYSTSVYTMPAGALLMLGRAYRAVGNYPAAYTTFQTILDQYNTDPLYGLAWLEQGRTLYWEGDTAGAINRYYELATTHPELPEAADALYRAGFLHAELGSTEQALEILSTLGTNYPGTIYAQDGLVLAATMAFNAGQIERAQGLYTQLANTGTGIIRAQAFLWLGRLYQMQGENELAVQTYQGAAQAAPGDYYSIRAADLLSGREPFDPPASYQFEFDDALQQAEAEQWLRQTFGIQETGPLSPLSSTLMADLRLIRGRELWELGLYEEANAEFDEIYVQYQNDALSSYQLAIFWRDLGAYKMSLYAAAAVILAAGVDTLDAPPFIARMRYPVYYKDLVLPEAEKWDVDPLLVFSLIRQESLYEGFVTSYAAAQGLMQIIPPTAEEIYGRLGWPENFQNTDVYHPYINVAYGVFYLHWTMEYVGGYPYAALAGYNGGPGNAATWVDISGPDIDQFIQTIPIEAGYEETRNYVERIYEHYHIYRALYGKNG